jgi:hypothetical protein
MTTSGNGDTFPALLLSIWLECTNRSGLPDDLRERFFAHPCIPKLIWRLQLDGRDLLTEAGEAAVEFDLARDEIDDPDVVPVDGVLKLRRWLEVALAFAAVDTAERDINSDGLLGPSVFWWAGPDPEIFEEAESGELW